MFDLRYHVASLAAVFLALIIGIVVGVGISGKGFVSDSERSLLNQRIADLNSRLDSASKRTSDLTKAQRAAQSFVSDTYPALIGGRATGLQVGLVFAGPVDNRMRGLVEQTLTDAGGSAPLRLRALKLPIDLVALRKALAGHPAFVALATQKRIGDLGRRLGIDLVAGGGAVWPLISDVLLEERSGPDAPAVDAVIVERSVPAQSGVTARFLAGLYSGLASAGVPAIGVERSKVADTAIEAFGRQDLSTVDNLDTQPGRLSLALLLAGATPGHYGVKKSAKDGVLPPVAPVVGG